MAGVGHVDKEVGVVQFLERRPERRDERRRQLVHEADGVGEQDRATAVHRHAARRRVERRERLVRDEDVRAREQVEQRGLADVGVADERGEEETLAAPRAAAALALRLHLSQTRLEVEEPALDDAAIGLEERLTRAARSDATTEPRQALPDPAEPWHLVLELRELDL